MSSEYGELRPTSGWNPLASLRHPCKFQRVSRLGSITAHHSSNGRQPNFAALNRGCHLYSAGRLSRWALAHISSIISSNSGSSNSSSSSCCKTDVCDTWRMWLVRCCDCVDDRTTHWVIDRDSLCDISLSWRCSATDNPVDWWRDEPVSAARSVKYESSAASASPHVALVVLAVWHHCMFSNHVGAALMQVHYLIA